MVFQFNQIVSPLWQVSAKADHNERMNESTLRANAAYTLNA